MTPRVAVASIAGAPGVSTLVAAMAAASRRPLLVVECPPHGGVLAVRWGWPRDRNLADLAIDGAGPTDDLWDQARPWVGASRLLPADPSAITMCRTTPAAWLAGQLDRCSVPVLIDLGRLQPDDETMELVRAVDRLWLVLDPTVEQATAAAAWKPELDRVCTVELVLSAGRRRAADGRYPPREVSSVLGWSVLAELPWDRTGAAAMRGVGAPSEWVLVRLPLVRHAGELLVRLGDGTREEMSA